MSREPSQCDRVLHVLADGLWHDIGEIHERAGTMRLNSRVAELRARRGLAIEHRQQGGVHSYRLLGSLPESPLSLPPPGPVAMQEELACEDGWGGSGTEFEQLSLEAA